MSQVEGLFVSAQSFILSVALIILYVGFLFAESEYVGDKIAALFPAGEKARDVDRMLSAISGSIRRYIWIMSLVSALTGLLSYMVLHWIGVDFAETWALLIFFLNYIPNVGSVLGVVFPALLALVLRSGNSSRRTLTAIQPDHAPRAVRLCMICKGWVNWGVILWCSR